MHKPSLPATSDRDHNAASRWPRILKGNRWSWGVFALTLLFYLITLQPGLTWGDGVRLQREVITGESFILAEIVDIDFAPDPFPFARLGVAAWDHPLYVIIGHLLVRSLPFLPPTWPVNLMSALFGALTLLLFVRLVERAVGNKLAALLSGLLLAISHTFWWHATTPEVYTLFSALLLATLYCLSTWLHENTDRYWALGTAAFLLGLGLSNHLLAGLLLPALGLFIVWQWFAPLESIRPLPQLSARRLLLAALLFAAGFLPYAIQALRLLRTFAPDELLGPALGTTFFSGSLVSTPGELAQSAVTYLVFLLYQFGPVGLILGWLGWWRGRQIAPSYWRILLLLYLVFTAFGLLYTVSDQFAFFLGSHLFWAGAIGFGLAHLLRHADRPRLYIGATIVSIFGLPLLYAAAPAILRVANIDDAAFGVPQIGVGRRDGLRYYLDPNKAGDRSAEEFGVETLASLPENALLLAQWYTDTDEYFVLRYYAVVEGVRPDVTIEGWPTVDPFQFDAELALNLVQKGIGTRPVYLASLSDTYYGAITLAQRYCIIEEMALYRVLPASQNRPCLSPAYVESQQDVP